MKKALPLVSVVMPSYNSQSTIKKSIESILEQDYENWELLITDDCSSDKTVEIINRYIESDCRIKLSINRTNLGSGSSRNSSIRRAEGKYIAFLDADDLWRKEKLSKQIAFMEDNTYAFTYTNYQKFDARGKRGILYTPSSVTYEQLLPNNIIGCLTAVYNVDIIGKKYMPSIRKKQDFALWLNILKDQRVAFGLNETLADYRCDSGVTSNKFAVLSHQWLFYRNVVGLSLYQSCVTFISYAATGFLKYIK